MRKRKLIKYREIRLLTPVDGLENSGWNVTKIPMNYRGYEFDAYFRHEDILVENDALRKHNRYNKKGYLTSIVRSLTLKIHEDYWQGVNVNVRIPLEYNDTYDLTYIVDHNKLKASIRKVVYKLTGLVIGEKDIIPCSYGNTYRVFDEYTDQDQKKLLYHFSQPVSSFYIKIPNERTRKVLRLQLSGL
jgi:hypothetical protein